MSLSQLGSLYLQSPWLKREACYKLCLQGPLLSLPHLKVAGQGSLQGVNVERWPATGKALSRDSGLGKIRGSPQNKGSNSGSLGWESLVCRNWISHLKTQPVAIWHPWRLRLSHSACIFMQNKMQMSPLNSLSLSCQAGILGSWQYLLCLCPLLKSFFKKVGHGTPKGSVVTFNSITVFTETLLSAKDHSGLQELTGKSQVIAPEEFVRAREISSSGQSLN